MSRRNRINLRRREDNALRNQARAKQAEAATKPKGKTK